MIATDPSIKGSQQEHIRKGNTVEEGQCWLSKFTEQDAPQKRENISKHLLMVECAQMAINHTSHITRGQMDGETERGTGREGGRGRGERGSEGMSE